MRKTRHRRRSRRRRSRKMRGGMDLGIGNIFAKAGSFLGLTRPPPEEREERTKSPAPTESPFEPVAKVESDNDMREPKPEESVGESPEQMGGKKRRSRRKSKKKRGGGCGCASPMTGGKRKRRRRRTHKKKRKSRRGRR